MDWLNHKFNERDPLTMQTRITFKDLATNQPSAQNFPSNPNGVTRAAPLAIEQLKVQEHADGYTMEMKLNWQSLFDNPWLTGSDHFTPKPGTVIGCAMALGNRPILGGFVKKHADPSTWGVMQLLATNQQIVPQTQAITLNTALKPQTSHAQQAYLYQLMPMDHTNWDYPKSSQWDQSGLHLSNNQQVLQIAKPITGLSAELDHEFTFTISSFSQTQSSEKRFRTHARFFLTPLDKGTEPYSLTDTLSMVINYQDNDDTTMTLYAKHAQEKGGYGKLLWRGSLSEDQYPLTISIKLNDSTYKISSPQTIMTNGGSLSGKHDLPTELWKKDLRTGIKSCFGSSPGQVNIKTFNIR
jgi:hypothetical protein